MRFRQHDGAHRVSLFVLLLAMLPHSSHSKHRLLIFGPPGVGKGTQSRQLVEKYGVCHVSTGDMLRAEANAARPTPLGKRAKQLMAAGKLLPDNLVIRMVQRRLRKDRACRKFGWLLDGFPRTPGQAHSMVASGLVPQHIVVLNANATTLIQRSAARARAAAARGEAPRADDNEATMRKRLAEYERQRDGTLAALRSYLRIANITSAGPIAEVASRIAAVLPRAIDTQLGTS